MVTDAPVICIEDRDKLTKANSATVAHIMERESFAKPNRTTISLIRSDKQVYESFFIVE